MDDVALALREALGEALAPHVRRRLHTHGIPEPEGFDAVLQSARVELDSQLEELLALPFPDQARGPLELFQEAMQGPTAALDSLGVDPVARDDIARAALPGDTYDLAPASSNELGEDAWHAHLAWGAAKAAAMRHLSGG